MPFHTYGQFVVPLRACRIYISLLFLCTESLWVASRRCCIATQSVRFVFPGAFFLLRTFSLLLFSYFCLANLYLSPGETFAKRRFSYLVQRYVHVSIKISYAAIRTISIFLVVCLTTEDSVCIPGVVVEGQRNVFLE